MTDDERRPVSGEGKRSQLSRRRFLNAAAALAAAGAIAGAVPALFKFTENRTPAAAPDANAQATKAHVIEAIKKVNDPEIPVNIYDLGLVYGVDMDPASGKVVVRMTLTSPQCPANRWIPQMVKARLAELRGVKDVDVQIVWDPRWTPDMMSAEAKKQFEWGLWSLPTYP